MTEITSLINSLVRLWKINHSGPGCRFYEFYDWYTRVYIINGNSSNASAKISPVSVQYGLARSSL